MSRFPRRIYMREVKSLDGEYTTLEPLYASREDAVSVAEAGVMIVEYGLIGPLVSRVVKALPQEEMPL